MQVILQTNGSYCDLCTVLFAVGLQDGANWSFGPVIFTDITIATYDKGTSWCTQAWDQFGLTTAPIVVGAKPKVFPHHTECHIDSVTLKP